MPLQEVSSALLGQGDSRDKLKVDGSGTTAMLTRGALKCRFGGFLPNCEFPNISDPPPTPHPPTRLCVVEMLRNSNIPILPPTPRTLRPPPAPPPPFHSGIPPCPYTP